ncbi:hypothetical protein [uncultured Roseovarius sp.]|uniref:hypothetical protein n=1 Tax=Roseovarius sp. TaxID=1486281 RepID=UPI0025EFB347|nr:hypothetical protein [uncultured Roseovarius sp.]
MNTTAKFISLADPMGSMLASGWAWHDSEQPIIARTHNYLAALATGANKLRDEVAAQRAAGRLTETGLKEHLVRFLSREFAPAYRRADRDGRRGIKRQIETFRAQGVRAIEPTDVAAAILRSDLRRMFFDLPEMARTALLIEPPVILSTALLELPEAFHRLDADELRERAFGADFPELSVQIDELRAVHLFVASSLTVARDDAMSSAGIDLCEFNLAVWNGDPAN